MSVDSQRDLDLSSTASAADAELEAGTAFKHLEDILREDPVRLGRVRDSQKAFERYLSAQIAIFDYEYDGTTAPLRRNETAKVLWRHRLEAIEQLIQEIRPDEGAA